MKVSVKSFDVDMDLKNKGVELDIANTDGSHLGDLVITKTQLIWCPGKTHRKNGISVNWDTFAKWMESRQG